MPNTIKELFGCAAVALGFATTTATSAWAGYVVERGSGVAVCDAYEQDLNTGNPKAPYAAGRPAVASSQGLRTAEWVPVPDGRGFPADLIVEFFWRRDANPAWHLVYPDEWINWRGTPQQIKRAKGHYLERIGNEKNGYAQEVSFRMSRVDIDNDGQVEPVVQFSTNGLAKVLLVLTAEGTDIDRKKSRLLLRHRPWGDKGSAAFRKAEPGNSINPAFERAGMEPAEDALSRAVYEVATFASKTYFDLWWLKQPLNARSRAPSPSEWRLSVYRADKAQVREVCSLRFEVPSQ